MGRRGGVYEKDDKGAKKRIGGTKPAKPVDASKTKLELHEAAQKESATKIKGKGA